MFTVLLLVACLYQLSFSWVVNGVDSKAETYAKNQLSNVKLENPDQWVNGSEVVDITKPAGEGRVLDHFEKEYHQEHVNDGVYPIFGMTYEQCKSRQINFGLDLQGGMSVTLEVSATGLVDNLAKNPIEVGFRKPYEAALEKFVDGGSQGDFVDMFLQEFKEFNKDDPSASLARYYYLADKEKYPLDLSDDAIAEILKEEAATAIDKTERIIEARINKFGVSQPTIQKQSGTQRLFVDLPGIDDAGKIRKLLQSTANLSFWETYPNNEAFQMLTAIEEKVSRRMYPEFWLGEDNEKADSVDTDVDSTGAAESTDELASFDSEEDSLLAAELDELDSLNGDTANGDELAEDDPNSDLSEEELGKKYVFQRRVAPNINQDRTRWFPGARIGYIATKDTAVFSAALRIAREEGLLDRRLQICYDAKAENGGLSLYGIKKTENGTPYVDGENITRAMQGTDQTGKITVNIGMDQNGAIAWADMTKKNIKKAVAIVMDDVVYSCPIVQGEITGGQTEISGNFQIDEAKALASILEAGALPAPAKIVDEAIVGPILGKENIDSGFRSFMIALLIVLIYMVFYYAKAGVVANIALVINVLLIVGTLAALTASLTLPGIAGIVLTIGMSVDANVLIYERIREELRAGKGLKLAIADGYKRAYSAIVDANVTTLLTAIILAYFGSGPIKGFATTLIIGIFTSLFSAIFITRLIFSYMLDAKKEVSFSTKATENWLTKTAIQFIKKRKVYYGVSLLVIIAGVTSLVVRGLDAGVEFSGGRKYRVAFEESPDQSTIKNALANVFLDKDGVKQSPEVKTVGASYENTLEITTKYRIKETGPEVAEEVEMLLMGTLDGLGNKATKAASRQVDPSISSGLIWSSVKAILFALIAIFLYIRFRFSKMVFGVGALLAMFHDVLVVLGIFSIFWGILPFSMEIDQAFIAAILTVVGYSINDTVVVFDRIREYIGVHKRENVEEVVNSALNSTLSRTLNTSVSTFLVLLMIFVFGGDTIKGFVFALMVGVVVGTYSSICVATTSVIDIAKDKLMPVYGLPDRKKP